MFRVLENVELNIKLNGYLRDCMPAEGCGEVVPTGYKGDPPAAMPPPYADGPLFTGSSLTRLKLH